MEQWYAVYTKPRAEKKAAQALVSSGIETYMPLQTTLKQWSDRKKKVEEPLFKSYLFVRINYERDHLLVLQQQHIVKFIRIGQDLVPVRDTIIHTIKLALQQTDELLLIPHSLKPSQMVKVIAGPFMGLLGTIERIQGSRLVGITIEQLGTRLLLRIPAAHLEPVHALQPDVH